MSDEFDKRLAQLKAAYDGGHLGADTYRAAVAGLSTAGIPIGTSGSGTTAQSGGTAAGAGGVAVGRDVYGNIYMGARPTDDRQALAIYRRMFLGSATPPAGLWSPAAPSPTSTRPGS